MAFPNEHAAHVKKPTSFKNNTFLSKELERGIRVISGIVRNTKRRAYQTYRFDRRMYTPQQARNWLRARGVSFILFEKAINE